MNFELPLHMIDVFKIWGVGSGIALVFALFSEMFLRRQEKQKLLPKDAIANAVFFSFGPPLLEAVITNALLIAALFVVFQLTPLRVSITPWTLVLYFLVGEFSFYWAHRLGHEVRILWCDHSIHHSSQEYDVTTNLRHTPFMFLYRVIAYAPAVALGFHPVLLVMFAINASAFQTFCHTQRLGRFAPWFEKTFVTPSNHIVHHACNPEYLDKNYGGLLVLWDRIFGTYQPLLDTVPAKFGITKQVNSSNPVTIVTHEFKNLWRDFSAAPTWRLKFGVVFGKPGKTFEAGDKNKVAEAINGPLGAN